MRYKGRSTAAARPAPLRTFDKIRPLLNRFVLPIYCDPAAPPLDIMFDTIEAVLAHKARIIEMDRLEFERT